MLIFRGRVRVRARVRGRGRAMTKVGVVSACSKPNLIGATLPLDSRLPLALILY